MIRNKTIYGGNLDIFKIYIYLTPNSNDGNKTIEKESVASEK